VNYQSVGSGAGLRQFINYTVAFAASNVPMQPKQIAKVNQGVVQLPMTAGTGVGPKQPRPGLHSALAL
jgi:phosphate transport system substrate-binding protein